jgi:hypothetical protein
MATRAAQARTQDERGPGSALREADGIEWKLLGNGCGIIRRIVD